MRKGLWFVVGVAAVCYYLLRPHGTLTSSSDGPSTSQTTLLSPPSPVVEVPTPSTATPDSEISVSEASTSEKPSAAEPVVTPEPTVPYIPDTGDPVDSMGRPRSHSNNASNSASGSVGVGSDLGGDTVRGASMTMLSRGVSVQADRDGAMNGCHGGTLLLRGPSMSFTCPAPHENRGVTLTVDQVKGVDKNGIELISKEKYHFHVKDMNEEQVTRLFGNWIREAKASSSGVGS